MGQILLYFPTKLEVTVALWVKTQQFRNWKHFGKHIVEGSERSSPVNCCVL